ncbi:MAG: pilus assembly protein [Alphaproteobacteria bacterium]
MNGFLGAAMTVARRIADRRSDEGVSAVEFALFTPIILLAVLGTLDFGQAIYNTAEIKNAVRAGAQYAYGNSSDTAGIEAAIRAAVVPNLDPSTVTVTTSQSCSCSDGTAVSCSSTCTGGKTPRLYVTINATTTYTTMMSYPGVDNPMTLAGDSVVRVR